MLGLGGSRVFGGPEPKIKGLDVKIQAWDLKLRTGAFKLRFGIGTSN